MPMILSRFGVGVLTMRASTFRSSARIEMGHTSRRAAKTVMECQLGSVMTSPITAIAMSTWTRSVFWLTTLKTPRQPCKDIGVMLVAA